MPELKMKASPGHAARHTAAASPVKGNLKHPAPKKLSKRAKAYEAAKVLSTAGMSRLYR